MRYPYWPLQVDKAIVDVANEPQHAKQVPMLAWQHAVSTGVFGDKTAQQVQNRYRSLRKAKEDAGASLSDMQLGPKEKRAKLDDTERMFKVLRRNFEKSQKMSLRTCQPFYNTFCMDDCQAFFVP